MSKHNRVGLTGRGNIHAVVCKLIGQGLESKVSELLSALSARQDELGRAAVLRNDYRPARDIQIGIGPVNENVPKIRSRDGQPVSFCSALVLLDIKSRGTHSPEVAIGDDAMDFWAAVEEVDPANRFDEALHFATVGIMANDNPRDA